MPTCRCRFRSGALAGVFYLPPGPAYLFFSLLARADEVIE